MLACHVFIATSLDGFIARADGAIDWLLENDLPEEDHGYDAFMATVDGLIMGRASYETVLGFDVDWPYPKPVVVMSGTLTDADVPAALKDRVRVLPGSPREVLATLEAEGWNHAYLDGGRLIQAFLREGLVADMIVTRIPVLIGEGRPLFGALSRDVPLHHVETKAFPSGLVQSKYEIVRRTAAPDR